MLIKFKNGGDFLATPLVENGQHWFMIRQGTDIGTAVQTNLTLESAVDLYNELKNYIEQYGVDDEDQDSED